MSAKRVIGIDFGTSTSVMKIKRYEGDTPIGDRTDIINVQFGNSSFVPTIIRELNGNYYYGWDAEPERRNSVFYSNFKLGLEANNDEEREESKKLTKLFFEFMYDQYASLSNGGYLGNSDDVEECIISFPVKWKEETRNFMIDTAREAGFKNVTGIDEAAAAVHAVIVQNEQEFTKKGYFTENVPVNIMVIDMGAGTTDLTICRYTPGEEPECEIICTYPEKANLFFGGAEVDTLLCEYMIEKIKDDDRLVKYCEKNPQLFKSWKEHVVSPQLNNNDTVSDCAFISNIAEIYDTELPEFRFDRQEWEEYASDYLKTFIELINGCLSVSRVKGEDIDFVITTGGHSQWYFVRDIINEVDGLERISNSKIFNTAYPQETVAGGLVLSPMTVVIKEEGLSTQGEENIEGDFDLTDEITAYLEESKFYNKNKDEFLKLDRNKLKRSFDIKENENILFACITGGTVLKYGAGWVITGTGVYLRRRGSAADFCSWKAIVDGGAVDVEFKKPGLSSIALDLALILLGNPITVTAGLSALLLTEKGSYEGTADFFSEFFIWIKALSESK